LRSGIYDIVLAMTAEGPAEGAYLTWREPLTWVGNEARPSFGADEPVRLVCYPEGCLYRRQLLSALQRYGRLFDIVYTSPEFGRDFGGRVDGVRRHGSRSAHRARTVAMRAVGGPSVCRRAQPVSAPALIEAASFRTEMRRS
jgi:hypothetical protein